MRIPKKNSVEWIACERFTDAPNGLKIGLKYVGGKAARAWALRATALQLAEARELGELRKGASKDVAPDLWREGTMTDTTMAGWLELIDSVIDQCVAGLCDDDGEIDAERAKEWAQDLPFVALVGLFRAAVDLQNPTRPEIFTSDPGVVARG